jgi:hypothetical protein
MYLPQILRTAAALALLGTGLLQAGAEVRIEKVSVRARNPLLLFVQLSSPASPEAQIITNPERLVIDVRGCVPASSLRRLTVNDGAVKQVRVGLFSSAPPITRIVLDLNTPQWYRIIPERSGFTVKVGSDGADLAQGGDDQPAVGWLLTGSQQRESSSQHRPAEVKQPTAPNKPARGMRVAFANGLLEIHANSATLSEVLFQIQQQTGAEIAIPAGTEQERVFGDFGPAHPGEVLSQLLNGTDLNFVVVGSEGNPNLLRSVILSRKTGFAEYIPSDTPPVAENDPVPQAALAPQPDPNPPPPVVQDGVPLDPPQN